MNVKEMQTVIVFWNLNFSLLEIMAPPHKSIPVKRLFLA